MGDINIINKGESTGLGEGIHFDDDEDASTSKRRGTVDAEYCVGVDAALDKVIGWLEKRFADNADFVGDATLVLSPLGIGDTSPIATFTFAAGGDHIELATQIVDAAQDDGDAYGTGTRKYAVVERDAKSNRSRCSFILKYREKEDAELDELPDVKGITAQLMRHVERKDKMMIEQMKIITATTRGMMGMVIEENRQHRLTYAEDRRTYGEMTANKARLDIENMKAVKAEARKDQMGEFLKATLPHMLSQVAGLVRPATAPVGAQTLLEDQTYAMLKMFSAEQLQQFMGIMNTEQQITFMHTLKAYQDRFEREEAEKAKKEQTNGIHVKEAVVAPPPGQTEKDPALSNGA